MKTVLSAIVGGLIGASLVLWGSIKLVAFVLSFVPVTPWAGLIKVSIVIISVVFGLGTGLALTFVLSTMFAAVAAIVIGLLTGELE